jgi:outer membrane protein
MVRALPPQPPRLRIRGGRRPRGAPLRIPPVGILTAILAGFALGGPSALAAQGAPDGLSLEAAIARASGVQSSVLGARGELENASWGVRVARAAFLPSASVGSSASWQGRGEQQLGSFTAGELGFVGQPTWLFSSWRAGLSLNLSGTTFLAPREAALAVEGAEARVRAVQGSVAFEVTRSYLDVLRREEGVRIASQELERALGNEALARGRVEVGSATPLDARQAEVATGRARIALLREEGELEGARITLRLLLGGSPSDPLPPLTTRFELVDVESVAETLVARGLGVGGGAGEGMGGTSGGGLVAEALRSNPELAQLRSQAAQSAVQVQSARSQFYPTVSISAGWGGFTRRAVDGDVLVAQGEAQTVAQRAQCLSQNDLRARLTPPLPPLNCDAISFGDAERARILDQNRRFPFDFTGQPPSLSLSVNVPVFQGLQRQRQLEVAEVNRRQSALRADERERTLAGDIARGATTLRTALAAARLETENLEVARAQQRLARDQYEVGLTDFLQLSESESVLARAERERLNAIFAVHEAMASLELLVGTSLRTR